MKQKTAQLTFIQQFSRFRMLLQKNLSSLIFAGWVLLFVQVGSHELRVLSDKVLVLFNHAKAYVFQPGAQEIETTEAPEIAESIKKSGIISSSPYSRELDKIDAEFPLTVRNEIDAERSREKIIFRAKSILLTDKNRPRVNQQFAEVFSPLIARLRADPRKLQIFLVAGDQIPEEWQIPISKFMQRFYGMTVEITSSSSPQDFDLVVEVSK